MLAYKRISCLTGFSIISSTLVEAHYNDCIIPIPPSNSRAGKYKTIRRSSIGNASVKKNQFDVRGGGGAVIDAEPKGSLKQFAIKASDSNENVRNIPIEDRNKNSLISDGSVLKKDCDDRKNYHRKIRTTESESHNLQVKAVLLPRRTSILKPLRFLAILLINICLSSCIQTSGTPMEEAVRRLLGMPSPANDCTDLLARGSSASKVTPLHVYVAKNVLKTSTSSMFVEMLPPAHLPSPLPLLGLFCSIILYVGGTILAPTWSVRVAAFLSYEQLEMNQHEHDMLEICSKLKNWFELELEDSADPYYESSARNSSHAAVIVNDISSGSKDIICPLFKSPGHDRDSDKTSFSLTDDYLDHPRCYYFECNGKRFYYDPSYQGDSDSEPSLVSGSPNIDKMPISHILSNHITRGLCTRSKVRRAQERYGPYSHITIPVPTLSSAFVSRISSPLVFLQFIGKMLSILEDESIGKSIANLFKLAFQHVADAKVSIEAAVTLANEVKDNEDTCDKGNGIKIWAVRPKAESSLVKKSKGRKSTAEWVLLSRTDLLPGDVFFIEGNNFATASASIPADAVLLEGSCVTDEAALNGESVPQAKVPLEVDESRDQNQLHMNGHHRSSCLFAGTKLLHSSNDVTSLHESKVFCSLPPLPKAFRTIEYAPALFLSVRTGSYSTRGQIVQSLRRARTKSNLGEVSKLNDQIDSTRLITALSVFAIGVACVYLLFDKDTNQRDSLFRRTLQCTRIIVAAVPSDLPASLSASARSCAATLREEDVVCSDPGALLHAARVDCCVFDKTGTLTADTQSLISIIHPPKKKRMDSNYFLMSNIVLAGCHTLVNLGDDLVGDPLDKACLSFSGWMYDSRHKSAQGKNAEIWQIRSFPFDPNRKLSSAIILARSDGDFRLWVVTKGAPDVIRNLCDDNLTKWHNSKVKKFGGLGYRMIGLGALDASRSQVSRALFPLGLPKYDESSDNDILRIVQQARIHAQDIHRNEIESSSLILNNEPFKFTGFACFDAPVRGSTSRVVNELKGANIQLKMLTGDDIYASLAAAKKANILSEPDTQNIHILKLNASGEIIWEVNNEPTTLTLSMAKKINRQIIRKIGELAVQGNAMSSILSNGETDSVKTYVRSVLLPRASLISNASPENKHLFVKWLRESCNKCVMMCGDGLNDIHAMSEADVSVAMLSGFGIHLAEDKATADVADKIRIERLKKRRIGSNRIAKTQTHSINDEDVLGIGNTPAAATARIQRRLLEYKLSDSPSNPFRVLLSSVREEIRRNNELKRGGSGAAKILAEEDRLRQCLQLKTKIEGTSDPAQPNDERFAIRTSEACLASSFTLLRPCVSGVETVVRTGIAAAASSITLYRKIALNCMLSSYNLATLYKNGLRYGKWMWQVELAGIMFADRASFMASSIPRPRIAHVRPSSSLFHPAEALSTVLQAIIHMCTLTFAVRHGKRLESLHPSQNGHNGFRIRPTKETGEGKTPTVGAVLSSLVGTTSSAIITQINAHVPSVNQQSVFRRSPFQPNHVTNNVFIMSVFQNAVLVLINHSGRPFSVAFLESRPLCLSVGLSFLLSIVCVAETFPMVNSYLQLAPFPTKASKLAMLRLLLIDISLNYFVEYLSGLVFRRDVWMERNKPIVTLSDHAADRELKLLFDERRQNVAILGVLFLLECGIILTQIMP